MIRFARAACIAVTLMAASSLAGATTRSVDVDGFIKRDAFTQIKISPTGEYFAATVPMADRTALVILRRSDNALLASANLGRNKHVANFWWASDGYVLFSGAEKIGELDRPQSTGDIYATSINGKTDILVGQSVAVMGLGSNIRPKKIERVAAHMVDTLRDSETEVLVSVQPFTQDPFTRVDRMNIVTGRRTPVARAPVRNASFLTDHAGEVRVANGLHTDNAWRLYLRKGKGDEWTLVNDEATSNRIDWPIGFSNDNLTLYLQSERDDGPDVIVAYDVASGARKEVLRDDNRDPSSIIFSITNDAPVGVLYQDGKARTAFFDPASSDARQYRSLEAAFPDHSPLVTSQTKDGKLTLVQVSSDRNPGDYYLFDTEGKTAAHVLSRRAGVDPEQMAEVRPITLKARDGLALTGYVSIPHGSTGKDLPMVVMPHGGPYGLYESWFFDTDTQLLSAAGYAVLRLNYRGSGNHGRSFQQAGAREWGGKMQDDLTDATRWVVAQGIADGNRVCIHGASYGGYAALMGAAKEPSLYRCASGYVGVYDLPLMQAADGRDSKRLGNWSKEWVGEDAAALAAASPNRIADRIKVPVFLAAGGEDEIAPIEHSRRMEKALVAAGVPVQTLYYATEGHGFYVEENRREYYTRLLAFLGAHLGGATAGPSSAGAK
ncbi:S9 family peptidase [Luteimonas sp. MC1828]|uniref:alpha/beta hydrolase family protein n=1 Tax=Luteimonas sp. MC1828 TaxID=2799787 RepID=UPI0018F1EB8A|nr:S9 family peptidase [Luteimonas sp. MC1828]MBJ7574840.1 S9 family peptidase [Luteimonas sp. MC1828]